ncbi:hypothetical protein F4777DRAFT_541744 [Nemania sp. FL0916]|nr:hypothetical protein F4777DRAFT_541744 [Nemania sp. FL0916]
MATRGLAARRVPVLPKFFIYVVGLIILLSLAVLALAAYAQSLSGNYYYESGIPVFLLFVSIWTLLVYGGILAVERFAPQFYYRIGFLIGQLLSIIFWLTGWAWAASWAAYILSFDNYSSSDDIRGAWKAFGQTTAACAGIGAIVWVLCIVIIIIFCWACVRSPSPGPTDDVDHPNASEKPIPRCQPVFAA